MKCFNLWFPMLWNFIWKICKTLQSPSYILNAWFLMRSAISDLFIRKNFKQQGSKFLRLSQIFTPYGPHIPNLLTEPQFLSLWRVFSLFPFWTIGSKANFFLYSCTNFFFLRFFLSFLNLHTREKQPRYGICEVNAISLFESIPPKNQAINIH